MDVYSVAAACLGLYVCVCIGMRAHDVVCMCTGSYAYYADVCRKPVVYAHVYLSGFAVCCVCVRSCLYLYGLYVDVHTHTYPRTFAICFIQLNTRPIHVHTHLRNSIQTHAYR